MKTVAPDGARSRIVWLKGRMLRHYTVSAVKTQRSPPFRGLTRWIIYCFNAHDAVWMLLEQFRSWEGRKNIFELPRGRKVVTANEYPKNFMLDEIAREEKLEMPYILLFIQPTTAHHEIYSPGNCLMRMSEWWNWIPLEMEIEHHEKLRPSNGRNGWFVFAKSLNPRS